MDDSPRHSLIHHGLLHHLDGLLNHLDGLLNHLDGLLNHLDGLLQPLDGLLITLDGIALDGPLRPQRRRRDGRTRTQAW
jgi:hypothetical protein